MVEYFEEKQDDNHYSIVAFQISFPSFNSKLHISDIPPNLFLLKVSLFNHFFNVFNLNRFNQFNNFNCVIGHWKMANRRKGME